MTAADAIDGRLQVPESTGAKLMQDATSTHTSNGHALAAALGYAAHGWPPVPVTGKRPSCGDAWQLQATSDPAQVELLFRHNDHDGVGVVLGESAGIIDVECDNDQAEQTLLELFAGTIPTTPTFQSTRGKHRLFNWTDDLPEPNKAVFKIGQLEFRTGNGDKAAQTVFPPSNGRTWIVSPDDAAVAVISAEVIDRIKMKYAAKKQKRDKPTTRGEPRQVDSLDVPKWLLSRGAKLLETDTTPDGAARWFIECPGIAGHTNENGVRDCCVTQEPSGRLGGVCFHQSCGMDSWQAISTAIGKPTRGDFPPARTNGHAPSSPTRSINQPATEADDGPDDIPPWVGEDDPDDDAGDPWTAIKWPKGRTERANSRRFLKQFGDKVRFCHAWGKWLVWDNARWRIDDGGAVMRLAMATADSVWLDAKEHLTKDVVDFAVATSGHGKLSAMLKLAAADVSVAVDDLDANPWLLNCPNGTLDLRTGELRPHRREDNLTKLCPTNYTPDAGSYCWDGFLEGVFDGPTIDFMQKFLGYCLTGDVSEQILAVFYGIGSNGKSTLLNAIQHTLGTDFSPAAPPSLLMEKKTETHPTELAGLFGKRLVIAQETNAGARLAEATVKSLTGGDIISARRMREDFWQFSPTHKLILCTNHKPRVKGTDHAIWRRLVLILFGRKFWSADKAETGPDDLKQDKTLPAKLKAEAEGILAWMVQGCLDWKRGGLQIPDSVRAATEEYRNESDTLGRFVAESCLTMPSVRVKFSILYGELEKWCHDGGDNLPAKRFVGSWLKENGFKDHTNNGRWYLGIGLKAETTQP